MRYGMPQIADNYLRFIRVYEEAPHESAVAWAGLARACVENQSPPPVCQAAIILAASQPARFARRCFRRDHD
jgi:hypothetical protein